MTPSQKPLVHISTATMWGGAEIFEFNFCRHLMAVGQPVHFICQQGAPLEGRLKEASIPYTTIESAKRFSPKTSRRLREIIKGLDCKHVLLHHMKDLWLVAPALSKLPHVTCSGLIHTIVEIKKRDPFHRWLYRRVDQIVCTTTPQMRLLQPCLTVPADKYSVIPCFIESQKFSASKRSQSLRDSYGADADTVFIGCVGRLETAKGQAELLEAARILNEGKLGNSQTKWCMAFVGGDSPHDPNFRLQLVKRAEEYGLSSKVRFVSFQENVAELMASLDIFVMPSHKEAFGIVLTEAMASGVAAVSTRAGGVPDILDEGRTGLLAEPKNPEDLARKILELINDPERRHRFGEAAAKKAAEVYDVPHVMGRWLELFKRLEQVR